MSLLHHFGLLCSCEALLVFEEGIHENIFMRFPQHTQPHTTDEPISMFRALQDAAIRNSTKTRTFVAPINYTRNRRTGSRLAVVLSDCSTRQLTFVVIASYFEPESLRRKAGRHSDGIATKDLRRNLLSEATPLLRKTPAFPCCPSYMCILDNII